MRIAILPLGHRALPTGGKTIFAPGVLATRAAEELTKRGHQVDVYAPKDSIIKANLVTQDIESMFSQFGETKKTDPGFYSTLLHQYELYVASKLVEESSSYDIIHAHDYRKLMYFSSFVRCPIVYSYHGNPNDDSATEIDQLRFKKYYENNHFIAASSRQVELGREYMNFAGVVPHGVDVDQIPFSDSGDESLLYIGRLMKRKRPDVAINIAKELGKKITIVGAGHPTPEDQGYFTDQLEPSLTYSGVRNVGLVAYPDVYDYFAHAKALLLPIEWDEPFGMVMIEAMAAGTPVIAFGMGSVPEVVEDGVTGFVIQPGDLAGMKQAVEKLYAMPDADYQEMRRNCRARVEQKYTIAKMVDGFERIYQILVK